MSVEIMEKAENDRVRYTITRDETDVAQIVVPKDVLGPLTRRMLETLNRA